MARGVYFSLPQLFAAPRTTQDLWRRPQGGTDQVDAAQEHHERIYTMKTMKMTTIKTTARSLGLLVCVAAILGATGVARGSGGGIQSDTIRVNKCSYFFTGSYVELLVNASSSNTSARLSVYLPSGAYLGEVQNGGGKQYGGTVLLTPSVPATLTIASSAGGQITVPCVPYQP